MAIEVLDIPQPAPRPFGDEPLAPVAAEHTLDAGNTLLGTAHGVGFLWAPVGTTPPTDTTVPWPAGWKSGGYLSEDDKPTVSLNQESEGLPAWQSKSPIRTIITSRELTISNITFIEITPDTLAIFFNETAPTATADGAYSLDITAEGQAKEYAVGIDLKDGDKVVRMIFPRTTISATGDLVVDKKALTGLPITLQAMEQGGVLGTIKVGPAVAPSVFVPDTETLFVTEEYAQVIDSLNADSGESSESGANDSSADELQPSESESE